MVQFSLGKNSLDDTGNTLFESINIISDETQYNVNDVNDVFIAQLEHESNRLVESMVLSDRLVESIV